MDFTVNQAITVTQLGLFNGAFANPNAGFSGDDFVTLFNSSGTKLAQLEFGNGTGNGTNVAGTSDFVKQLTTPLQLSAGFTGSIISFYTGGTDQLHNSNGNVADTPAETGSPYLTYTGLGRNGGGNKDAYPINPDSGPPNRYHGATFGFTVVPEPGSALLLIIGAAGLLLVARRRR